MSPSQMYYMYIFCMPIFEILTYAVQYILWYEATAVTNVRSVSVKQYIHLKAHKYMLILYM